MAQTAWAMLPPLITIVLALLTKEVYMSLIIGIFSGALLFTDFSVLESIITMFEIMAISSGSYRQARFTSTSRIKSIL